MTVQDLINDLLCMPQDANVHLGEWDADKNLWINVSRRDIKVFNDACTNRVIIDRA
jgi:hypothetical protein